MGNSNSKTIDLRASDLAMPFPKIFDERDPAVRNLVARLVKEHAGSIGAFVDTHGAAAVLQGPDARVVTKLVEGTEHGDWTVRMTDTDALHVYALGWKMMAVMGGVEYPLQTYTPDEETLEGQLWGNHSIAWMRAILLAAATARKICKNP